MQITAKQAAKLITQSGGKLFRVTFEKRTKPGVMRHLTGRVDIKAKRFFSENPRKPKINPKDHDLLTVLEFVRDPRHDERGRIRCMGTQWRSFGIENIRRLKINGFTFDVV